MDLLMAAAVCLFFIFTHSATFFFFLADISEELDPT